MKKYYFLVIVLFILSGCTVIESERRPPFCDGTLTDLGIIYLNSNSLRFIPYDGEKSIYFKNNNGDVVKFESPYGPKTQSFQVITYEIGCDEGGKDNYIYRREQYSLSYLCTELNVMYHLSLLTHNSSEYPLFIDRLNVGLYVPPTTNDSFNQILHLVIITSYNNNEDLLKDEIGSFENYDFFDELELLNMTFKNVYKVTDFENTSSLTELYFNKDFGVIAFKKEFNIWVFDRFE